MKRDGRADTGVSIRLVAELVEFCEGWWEGGTGRANGLGGPDAPADSRADADGEGGGRTTPELWESLERSWPFRGREEGLVDERGEFESAVAEPPSAGCSSGICTIRTARLAPPCWAEFVREGGVNPSGIEDIETLRFLCV